MNRTDTSSHKAENFLDDGFAVHQKGEFESARLLYTIALTLEPENSEALHLLGLVEHQLGHTSEALEALAKATELDPAAVEYHHNHGEVLRSAGQLEGAVKAYVRAVELNAGAIESICGLGLAYHLLGKFEQAITSWRLANQLNPDDAQTYNNIGVALRQLRRFTEAGNEFRSALQVDPDYLEASRNLSRVLIDAQDYDAAILQARHFANTHPDNASAQTALAATFNMARRFEEAIEACRTALRIDANLAEAHYNLGIAFDGLGEFRGAALAYAKTTELEPDRFSPHVNLGLAYLSVGELGRAAEAFSKGSALNFNDPTVLYNLAITYERSGQNKKGIETMLRALELKPDWIAGQALLAMFYYRSGEHDTAEEIYSRILQKDPEQSIIWCKAAFVYVERGEHLRCFEAVKHSLALKSDPRTHGMLLFYSNCDSTHSPTEVFKLHQAWGKRYQEENAQSKVFPNDRDPSRRLRIGYVSPDLRGHAVSYFIGGVLAHHNHDQFEVIIYDEVASPDFVTYQFSKYADRWRRLVGLSDEKATEVVANDEVDILIDLAGHTGDNRMGIFARKPAPIQVTYLGYPNTTGLTSVDYRITDQYADPPGFSDTIHTEKLVRLPRTFLSYTPSPEAPAVTPLPAEKNGFVTFCSFNALTKVNLETIALWTRVLRSVPGSRLLIKGHGLSRPTTRQMFLDRFEAAGAPLERIEMVGKTLRFNDHLATYGRCDIGLDPYPYHGTTTTCEAFWMGIPVVSLAGSSHVSRVGVSLLNNVGLPELVASTTDEFVEIAKSLANNRERLAKLRAGMRERMLHSPLTDSATFTVNLESAYRKMWVEWCQQTSP